MHKITVYSTATCHYCQDAKQFLRDKGVEFQDHDVGKDKRARETMVNLSGGKMVPVIAVGDDIYVGFDKFKEAVDKGLRLV